MRTQDEHLCMTAIRMIEMLMKKPSLSVEQAEALGGITGIDLRAPGAHDDEAANEERDELALERAWLLHTIMHPGSIGFLVNFDNPDWSRFQA